MELGSLLGPYVIDRELGSGGMGTVYAATGPDGVVALKVVHPHLLETADAVERFRREVEIGQTIDHPNVVRTFGGGEADGHYFMAMEYVKGQTLDALLDELERVPEDLCRHIGREVCKGLGAIHAGGAIHRDIKPENVLITRDHVVKIMDLGVARSTDDALRLSQTGAFVGSLHYACPEQFIGGGKGLDGRVDLHALGLVLYELASGVCAFLADDIPQTIRKVLHDDPRRLGEINPQLSAFFEEVVHCLLAKDRDERFATADELCVALKSGEDGDWWRAHARALQLATRRPIRRARIPRETAVYGREDEIARLRVAYERAKSGDGNVVLIEGEAGVGKSRLVDELIARLQQAGEEINFLFGGYPPGGAATVDGGFSSAFREQFGVAGSAAYLPDNQVLVPAFDALLRGEGAPHDAQSLNKGSLQTCFVRATQTLASERMTVVLIDDLHFAPDEGRALFTSLAMALPGHCVLLMGTARPGVSEEWTAGLTRLDQTTQLALQRLSPKDLVQLLQDTLQSEHLARDLGNQIAVKSDGNPFFVFEILQGLRDGQFIRQTEDGAWIGTKVVEDIEIPSSVLDLVNARVADLTEEERDLLDVACCWGYEFDPVLIGEVLGMGRIPLLKRFAQIERKQRLVRAAGRHMVFDHHQVQEALYGSLLEQLREEYHAALAEALGTRTNAADQDPETLDGALCVDLADHYLKGARGESALRYLPAAQTHLTNGYLRAEVVALTERALAVPDLLTGAERAKTLLQLAAALDGLARRVRQEECAREAERLAETDGDDELRGNAARALGAVFYRTSRQPEATTAYRRALEFAVACGDQQAEAVATHGLGTVYQSLGRLGEAQEKYERSLAINREIGYREGEASSTMNLGNIFLILGRPAEAQEHYKRSLAQSRELGDLRSQAISTGNIGLAVQSQGRLSEARAHYERSLALSGESGFREVEANATASLGHVFKDLGRLREAAESYERYLVKSREIGYRAGEASALHNLGGVLWEQGELAEAEERLVACLVVSEEIEYRHATAATHLALGGLRAAAGDGKGGRESLAAARDLAAEIGLPGALTLARCELACLPGGDPADALAALSEHDERLSAGERLGARHLLWKATGDRAHLEEAKRLLDKSLANVPEESHEAMLTNLRAHREIMTACEEQGL